MTHRSALRLLALLLTLALAACLLPVTPDAPTPAPATPEPVATETPALAATATPEPTAAALDLLGLRAQFLADTGITLAPEGTYDTFTGVGIVPLTGDGAGLWAVHTAGMRSYTSAEEQPHLLALYTRDPAGWRQVGLQEIGANEAAGDPGADYIGEGGVTQAQVAPGRLWLQVDAGVGAHSGAYHLYSFDAAGFTVQATGFSASPGAGRVADITGDGIGEVLLDASDYDQCDRKPTSSLVG